MNDELHDIALQASNMGISYGEFVSKGYKVEKREKRKEREVKGLYPNGYKLNRRVKKVDKDGGEQIFDNAKVASQFEGIHMCVIYQRISSAKYIKGYKWSYVEDEF